MAAEVTDVKRGTKKWPNVLKVENARKKLFRAQMIKQAAKMSILRSILAGPPADWDFQRKQEYFEWAKNVVDGFMAPNPVLQAEFQSTLRKFDEVVRRAAPEQRAIAINSQRYLKF